MIAADVAAVPSKPSFLLADHEQCLASPVQSTKTCPASIGLVLTSDITGHIRLPVVPPLFLPECLAIEMLDLDDPALKEYLRIRDAEMSITFNRQVEEHVYRRTMELQQRIQDKHDGNVTLSRQ